MACINQRLMKIFTLLFHILTLLTAKAGRSVSLYISRIITPLQEIKPFLMQNIFAWMKKTFAVTVNRNTYPVNETPVFQPIGCCTTVVTNQVFPNNYNHDVAQPAASFVFKPTAMNKSEKRSLLEAVVRKCGVMVIAMLIANLFFVNHASGQTTRTWLPTTGGVWTTTTNWSGGAIPVNGDNVVINSNQSAVISAVPANLSLNNLTISGTCNLTSTLTPTLTVTGALSVSAGITVSFGTTGTSANRVNLTLSAASTGSSILGTVNMNTGGTAITFTNSGDLSIGSAGIIGGTSTGAASSFTLSAGATLRIASTAGITATGGGTNGNIQVDGTRTYTAGANYVYNGTAAQVTGSGLTASTPANLTISNSAGVSLSAATTISGLLTMSSGTLNMANTNLTVGALTGTTNITNSSGTAGARTITIGSNNNSTTYSGVISNGTATSVSLTKNGTGTLTLSGNNSYTGTTTISAGTLQLGAAGDGTNGPLGTVAGGTSVTSGATLDLNGFTLSTNEGLTLNGTGIAAGGALSNSSLTGSSYGGLITLGSASSIIANVGNISITNTGNITGNTFGLTLGGNSNGSLTSNLNTTSGTLTKSGTGTWVVSGNSSYTGLTTISAGILQLGAAGSGANSPLGTVTAGTLVSNGASLDLNGFSLATAEPLSINGTGISAGGALMNSGATANYSGLLVLGSASSIISSNGDINLTNAGTITGATFGLTLGGTGNGSISSIIGTTTGSLTKNGAGVWTLAGANTYSGTTTINAGELRLNPTTNTTPNSQIIMNGGILGTANIASNTTINNSSTLNINSGANTIALGSNVHSLMFANSSGITWNGTSLTVTGWQGVPGQSGTAGKIFFGNTLGTLTPTQLGQIHFANYPLAAIILVGTGEIVPQPSTPLLIITGNLNNGNSCVNSAASPQTYTITNNGAAQADGVSVVSSDGQFVVSNLSSTSIAPGLTATFDVKFTPTSSGAQGSTITVASTTSGSNSPTANVTGTGLALPAATFNYANASYCQALPSNPAPPSNPLPQFTGGAVAGTFSASPAGLVFVSTSTGQVDLTTSAPGTYTITNTVTGANGCVNSATTSFTVNQLPQAATISYGQASYCTDDISVAHVNLTLPAGTFAFGGAGFSASPAGLSISTSNGDITPSTSAPGTYTVTFINTNVTCNNSTTTTVIINTPASGTISYAQPAYCTNGGTATVTNNVTGTTTGATYSSTSGLSIDPASGAVNLALSTPGTYTVTYSVTASPCSTFTTTASITINPAPTVTTISYTSGAFCKSITSAPVTISTGGQGGGTFTASPAGLTIDPSTGEINPSTSTATTYTITYTYSNGLCSATATTTVTINALPTATISYAGPFCTSNGTAQAVTRTGQAGGTYSSTAGLTINAATGAITPSTSTPGTYTVTYTFTNGICSNTTTTTVTITLLPVATFSYTGSPYCHIGTNPSPTFSGGGVAGTFTSTAGLVFVSSATGQINLSASTPGTYTVTNTIAAANGCGAVVANSAVTILAIAGITSVTATPNTIFCGSSSNLVVAAPQEAATTILNYDFNATVASYAALVPAQVASNITSVVSGSTGFLQSGTSTATGANAFTTNATAGNALQFNPASTTNGLGWTFTLTGSALPKYKTFKVYFQVRSSANTGYNTVTLFYSLNGGTFISTNVSPANVTGISTVNSGTYVEALFTLPNTIDNPATSLAFQIQASAATAAQNFRLDNFQVQAVPTDTYSWTAIPAATAGLPGSAGSALVTNNNINVSPTATTQYTVTQTTVGGCATTSNVTVTVNYPSITLTTGDAPVNCNGSTSANLAYSATTGTPNQYSITYDANAQSAGFANVAFSALPANNIPIAVPSTITGGVYKGTLTVTNSFSSQCTSLAIPFTVTIPNAITTSIGSMINVDCHGNNTGSLTVTASGGMGSFSFSKDGIDFSNTTGTFGSLTAGTYNITAKDANGCTKIQTVVITEPSTLTASISSQTNVDCFGSSTGSVTVSGNGGSLPYHYSKDGIDFSNADGIFGNLIAGSYLITVKDGHGCTTTQAVTITQPTELTATAVVVNACADGTGGSVTITPTGGPDNNYSILSFFGPDITAGQTTSLPPGEYAYFVNSGSCEIEVDFTIQTPNTALGATTNSTNVSCNGNGDGSITVSGTGGYGTYQYSIDGGANWYPTVANSSPYTFPTLAPTTYTVQVRDGSNSSCTYSTSVTISEPILVTISASSTNVSCNGAGDGTITASASTGATITVNGNPYNPSATYGPGDYTVTATAPDGNNIGFCTASQIVSITEPIKVSITASGTNVSCNGAADGTITASASTGATITVEGNAYDPNAKYGPGTYHVVATAPNGNGNGFCTATQTVTISEPSAITIANDGTTSNVSCHGGNDGSITLGSVSGGAGSYGYHWTVSGGGTIPTGQENGANLTGLTGGTYTITITDANGCKTITSYTITDPALLVASATGTNVDCHGNNNGTASASASGGTAPYTYLWNNNSTAQSLSGLTAGIYTVTITDAKGCSKSSSYTVTEPNALIATPSGTNIDCNGNVNGTASVSVNGGTPGYTYSWSNGATTSSISGLAAGMYTVNVTDAHGCMTTASYTVTQPNILAATYTSTNISCFNANDGTATVNITGGTKFYQYNLDGNGWLGGTTDNSKSYAGLVAGSHTVMIKDAHGCTTSVTFILTQPTQLQALSSAGALSCTNGTTSLVVLASGGTPPYMYSLNNGPFGNGFVFTIGTGSFTVTVRDANMCTTTTSQITTAPTQLIVNISNQQPSGCNGNTGSFTVSGSGGTGPYTYSISINGITTYSSTGNFPGLAAGGYFVSVNDAQGCFASTVVNVGQAALPTAFNVIGGGTTCSNASGVMIGLSDAQAGLTYYLRTNGSNFNLQTYNTQGPGGFYFNNPVINGGTYIVVAYDPQSQCMNTMTGSATVVAGTQPTAIQVTGGGSFCSGPGVPVGLLYSENNVMYQLKLNGTINVGGAVVGNGSAISFGNQTTGGIYTVFATNILTGCTNNMLGAANVTAGTTPTSYAVMSDPNNCNGLGVQIKLAASQMNVTYQLYLNGAIDAAVPPVAGGNGSPINFGLQPSGTYTVVGMSAEGCLANMSGSVTVISGNTPTAFNVSGSGNYCSGGSGLAVGLPNSQTGVSYQLYNGATIVGPAIAGNNGSPISFGMQPAGTYTVTATNTATGCSSSMNGSAIIIVAPNPTAFTEVAPNGLYDCTGTGVDIQLNGSQSGFNYQLYLNNLPTASIMAGTGGVLDFGPRTSGVYSIVATNTTAGCTGSMSNTLTVVSGLAPAAQTLTGGGYSCSGTGLYIGLLNSQTGVNYQLVLNGHTNVGAAIGGTNGYSIDFGYLSTPGTYSVVATNATTGCTSSMANSVSISSGTAPTVTVNSPSVCGGSGATITATPSPAGTYTYVWTVPGNAVNPGNVQSFTATVSGQYSVTVTNGNGCTGTGTGTLTLNPATSVTVNSPSRCSTGPAVTITATPSPAGVYNYAWTVPGGVPNPGNVQSFSASVAGTYSVTISQNGSCSSSGSGMLTVSNGAPLVSAITGSTTVCAGNTIQLTDVTPGGVWSSTNTSIATVSSTGLVLGINGGTVTIKYTVTNACGSKYVQFNVTVNTVPVVQAITGASAVCPSSVIQLSDATPGGLWSSDNTFVATVNFSGKVTGINPGIANIMYSVVGPCGTTTVSKPVAVGCTKKNSLGDGDRLPFMDVQVLPNPSTNFFNLIISSSTDDAPTVRVFDMQGRQLQEKRGAIGEAIRIGDGLSAGTYVVQVIQGVNMKTVKVVKL
jgi:autotransporter-associated beta strand protein